MEYYQRCPVCGYERKITKKHIKKRKGDLKVNNVCPKCGSIMVIYEKF